MKKTKLLFLTFIFSMSIALFTVGCSKDDDSTGTSANSFIGTWKLIETYEGAKSISLSSCDLMETYIVGRDEQFSHELFGNSNGKNTNSYFFSQRGGDDDDDHSSNDDDDHSSDDDDDHSSSDNDDDHSSDDSDDDNGGGQTGTCTSKSLSIGYWKNTTDNVYSLNSNDISKNLTIIFTENNTKFYYEEVIVINGLTVIKKYVFARQ